MVEEARDTALKLFGKTISLPENTAPAASSMIGGGRDDGSGAVGGCSGGDKEKGCSRSTSNEEAEVSDSKERATAKVESEEDGTDANSEVQILVESSHESTHTTTILSPNENPQALSTESEFSNVQKASNTQEEEKKWQPNSSQEKTPKKPDKILPCPRCNSMETKFCYFNNYNVNQPRHFCKNCQRYWTAGGTIRNVPVGAGRRKSKSSVSQYHHVIVSESPRNPGGDIHSQGHYPSVKSTNGSLLTFGTDNPICESMASILNLVENKIQKVTSPLGTRENGGLDQIEGAGSVASESKAGAKEGGGSDSLHVYPPPVPCFPGPIWAYPWNPTQWGPQVQPPGLLGPNGFPLAFYPPGVYWGCSVPGSWAIPWFPPPLPSLNGSNSSSIPNPPTLGKHSRDGNLLRSSSSEEGETPKGNPSSERCLWVPKTLRIDDPDEAAKSSIWTTLGIKNHNPDSICGGGGIFKAYFSKVDDETCFVENSRTLEVNPAALSRSETFNESW